MSSFFRYFNTLSYVAQPPKSSWQELNIYLLKSDQIFTKETKGKAPADQMLRLKAFTVVLGEAPQNEYARFAVAFIYACALLFLVFR